MASPRAAWCIDPPCGSAIPVSRDPQPQKKRQNPTILLFSTALRLGIPDYSRVGLILGSLGRGSMILAALVGLSLVSSAAFDPQLTTPADRTTQPGVQMSAHQKAANASVRKQQSSMSVTADRATTAYQTEVRTITAAAAPVARP